MRRCSTMRSIALCGLVLAQALAGCIAVPAGDGAYALAPTAARELPEGQAAALATLVEAPLAWSVGDYWRFDVTRTDGSRLSAGLVVYREDAANYYLATDDRDYAIRQAVLDGDLLLGGFSKRDLARPSGFGTAKLFDWPLADNKTWTVAGFRGTFAVTARFVPDLPTPVGRSPGFEIEGTSGNGYRLRYDYALAVKWFTKLEFFAPDGSTMFSRTLAEYRERFDGQYLLLSPTTIYERTKSVTGSPADAVTVANPDFLVVLAETAGAGSAELRLLTPGGQVAWQMSASGADFRASSMQEVPSQAGSWELGSAMGGNGTARVTIVAIDELRGRLV